MVHYAPLYAIVDQEKGEFYENTPRSDTRRPTPAIYSTLVGVRCACARLNKQNPSQKLFKIVQLAKLILVEIE